MPQDRRRRLSHLVTTLTKRMAEDLTEFMHEAGVRSATCTRTWKRWNASN
jgi:excinuclease UvrABC helicase subunit UvrB